MILIKSDEHFQLIELDSEAELRSLSPNRLLGENTQLYGGFYLVKIAGRNRIGIITGGHGTMPNVKTVDKGIYFIDFDNNLCLFKENSLDIIEKSVDSFVQTTFVYKGNLIVVCELDIYSLTLDALKQVWHMPTEDLIVNYSIKGDTLGIEMEAAKRVIGLETGLEEGMND